MIDMTNAALIARLKSHLSNERRTLAEFLRTLVEVDRRRLHVELGYEYLGQYCEHELGLSEGEAWNRAKVAKVARRLPVVLAMIADGRHCLTSIRNLAPHLDGEGAGAILERAAGKSTREVKKIVAELIEAEERAARQAAPGVPAPLFARIRAAGSVPAPSTAAPTPTAPAPSGPEPRSRKRETIRHVTPTSFSVTFEADEATRGTLDRIMEIRRKQGKEATVAAAMKDMMELYLDKHDHARKLERRARRAAARAAKAPAAMPAEIGKPTSRYVPAREELAMYRRDGYRCAYVSREGRRCTATVSLHRDHIQPAALGGASEADNLRYYCASHNRLAAERSYGPEVVRRAIAASLRNDGGSADGRPGDRVAGSPSPS